MVFIFSTTARIAKLAVYLVRGEMARSPRALWSLMCETFRTLRGEAGLREYSAHPDVVAIEEAESAAPGASGPVARIATKFGLGLLRQGWVEEACWLLTLARRRSPDSPSLSVAADRIAGEVVVLRGEWQPPDFATGAFTPVPGRVLHIVGKSLPYTQAGYTIRTQSIAVAQRTIGLDPHIVTRPGFPAEVGGPDSTAMECVDGVTYHRLQGSRRARWDDRLDAAVTAISRVVAEVAPAVLHAHSDFENALVARVLGDAFGLPVVYEVRGFWEETWLSKYPGRSRNAARYRLRRAREISAAMAADRVVTLSEIMRARLVADGVPVDQIALVPNAVDPRAFAVVERDPLLATELGIEPDEVVVGYISSLVGYEGIDTLIDACAMLLREGLHLKCLIVGEGEDRQRLEKRAADLGIAQQVLFPGEVPREEIVRYYGAIDVFVVPRVSVPVTEIVTPLKPFEALSTGRSLVLSSVAALKPIAEDSGACELFAPGDSADLASVLRRLIADPRQRRELACRGAEWVRCERTWASNAERYARLYAGL